MKYNYTGFLSATQAARMIGISRQGIMKAIKENRIDAYRIGHSWVLKCEDVDKFRMNKLTIVAKG